MQAGGERLRASVYQCLMWLTGARTCDSAETV